MMKERIKKFLIQCFHDFLWFIYLPRDFEEWLKKEKKKDSVC
jgi:hypothetical protein